MKNKNNFWPIEGERNYSKRRAIFNRVFDWLRRFFSTRTFFLFKKKNILYIIPIDRKGKKNEKK